MKLALNGSDLAKMLSASGDVAGVFARDRVYHLQPVRLLKVGCPKEVSASRENVATGLPIVVEKNRNKFGRIMATNYWPEAIVVSGADRRARLLARGELNAMAWVEAGLGINIQADDEISCEELTSKLQNELYAKFYGPSGPLVNQPYPCVLQVYPFENYMIFCLAGQKYRQAYSLDPVARTVHLSEQSTKVDEKFVNASESGLPRTQTGMRQVSAPIPLASNQVAYRGGATCDLFTQVVRNFANVNATVNNLLSAIKNGLYKPMVPSFAPVQLSADHKIMQAFVNAGIAPADVVQYLAKRLEARKFSQGTRNKLAKKGIAKPDGSYPIATRKDLSNAVKDYGRSSDKTASDKAHIRQRAKALGAPDPFAGMRSQKVSKRGRRISGEAYA